MSSKALIYGAGGQDGVFLARLLSGKGYEVAGVFRLKPAVLPEGIIRPYFADLAGEPQDYLAPIEDFAPDEIYNLAAFHRHEFTSENRQAAFRANAEAPRQMLHRISGMGGNARFFQASSAYVYGGRGGKVDERTPPAPNSPYGESKLAAQQAVAQALQRGVFACSGILFNHESPLRGESFVTRKISSFAARAHLGMEKGKLVLGNLEAKRDWGYAGDYVEAMWLMLQMQKPDDYVVATGETHTVRQFCQEAFSCVGLDYKEYVESSPSLSRADETSIEADPSKAKRALGWKPKVGFKGLVKIMVEADMALLKGGGRA